MIILPAIDIKDGNCVRLVKGDYGTAHKVAESYMDTARMFESCGAEWIHMVDLDGAKDAAQTNKEIFLDVAKNTKLKVEVGGGIRTPEAAEMYLSGGVERVIIGSAAVKDPALVKTLVKEYGEHIAVGNLVGLCMLFPPYMSFDRVYAFQKDVLSQPYNIRGLGAGDITVLAQNMEKRRKLEHSGFLASKLRSSLLRCL